MGIAVKKWEIFIGLIAIITALCVAALPAGCGNDSTANQGPDYSDEANWLALPSSPG